MCKCGQEAIGKCHWCGEAYCADCMHYHIDGYCVAEIYADAYDTPH